MQTPTRHVTTAAVMGISTESEERLFDSAGGYGVSEAPMGHSAQHGVLCSSPSPTRIPHRDRQEGITLATHSDLSFPKTPCMRPALLSAAGAGALGGSLLCTGSALGTKHLPQITSEEFVPFTFTISPFSSQLQGRTRSLHSSNPSSAGAG